MLIDCVYIFFKKKTILGEVPIPTSDQVSKMYKVPNIYANEETIVTDAFPIIDEEVTENIKMYKVPDIYGMCTTL